jgi:hypothetical protein
MVFLIQSAFLPSEHESIIGQHLSGVGNHQDFFEEILAVTDCSGLQYSQDFLKPYFLQYVASIVKSKKLSKNLKECSDTLEMVKLA